jgi:glycosyltransferase involved in cell wall biosynthesis
MIVTPAALPLVWRNVRATRTWRPRDMVNWHRMVRSVRGLPAAEPAVDFFRLVVELCSTFEVDYLPQPPPGPAPALPPTPSGHRVALFVDAPDHLSGVATTLRQWSEQADAQGRSLRLFHSGHTDLFSNGVRFAPMGTLRLGAYEGLQVHMPVVADVLRRAAEARPDAIHVSTPGPMGLLGLLVARQLGLPLYGTYHTDFPSYAARLSGRSDVEAPAWGYMRWFYGQLDRVAAPSASTCTRLAEHGLDPRRLHVVGRGIRTDRFSPARRDATLRGQWGAGITHWLLYTGRLSREKNLQVLADAFARLHDRRPDVGLVLVGDGPYRAELEQRLAGRPVHFAGVQRGDELARIYASADLFVFPSETDTLGVVLLEAQASGLPVLVSRHGGPKDVMANGRTGWVVDPMQPAELAAAIEAACNDPISFHRMREAARAFATDHTPERSFAAFWQVNAAPVSSPHPEATTR